MDQTNQQNNAPPRQVGTIYAPPHAAPVLAYPDTPKKSPLKLLLGIALALLVVGGIIFAGFSLYQRMTNSGFTKLEQQSAKFGTATLTVDVPGHYEEIQSEEEAKTGIVWGDPRATGQLRITSSEEVINAEDMITLVDDIATNVNGQRNAAITEYEDAAKKLCASPKLGELNEKEIDGALAGYRIDFTCTSESGEQLKGTIMDGITGNNTISYTLLLPTQDWVAYKSQIQQSISSFSVKD